MKVYIGMAAPKKRFVPFAWLIQLVLHRKYDHVYIRFQEPKKDWMIFQASSTMVNLYNLNIWNNANTSMKEYTINITDIQQEILWEFIKANLGIPYSLKEDLGILLMKIFKLKDNPYSQGMTAEFCSELGANICNLLGIQMPEQTDNIDPATLDSILASKNLPCINNPNILVN